MAKSPNQIIEEDKLNLMFSWHNKYILELLNNSKAIITLVDKDFIFFIEPTNITFIIYKDLITKKNNYEIWYNQKVKQDLIRTTNGNVNINHLFSKIKQMVFIGKNEKVRKDEKFLTGVFDAINQFNYSYSLEHNNWTIFFRSNYFQDYFAKIFLQVNSIDDTQKMILLEDEAKEKSELMKNFFKIFFTSSFFEEKYYYITEYNSIGEKDISNTPELFNDCFQDGADILSHWSIFNDKQIIKVNGTKLYYQKKDAVFNPFYVFKIKPIKF